MRHGLDDEGVPHVQHLVGLHAYGVSDVPPGSEPDEQRKKMDSDPDSGNATASGRWRNLNPRVLVPNNGNHSKGEIGGRREISRRLCCVEKGDHPPLFIAPRGMPDFLP